MCCPILCNKQHLSYSLKGKGLICALTRPTQSLVSLLVFLSALFIFLISIYTFKIYHGGDELKANRISRLAGIALSVAYVAANIIVVSFS